MDRASQFSGTKEVDPKLLLDRGPIEKYLKNLLGNDTSLLDIKQFKGGQSNPTYLLQTNVRNFVLRRKPPGKLLASAHAVDREYKVISALNKTDVPVPKTYDLCEDISVAGTPFFLMDHVDGNIFWDLLLTKCSAEERNKIYWSMNDTIAKLHNTDFKSIGLDLYF